MDRGAWQDTVHGVANVHRVEKNWTQLKRLSTHTQLESGVHFYPINCTRSAGSQNGILVTGVHSQSEVGHCEQGRYSKKCLSGATVSHGIWSKGRGDGAIKDLLLDLCFEPLVLPPPFRVTGTGLLLLTAGSSTYTIPDPEKGTVNVCWMNYILHSHPQLFRLSTIVRFLQSCK